MTDIQTGAQILRRHVNRLRDEGTLGFYKGSELIGDINEIQQVLEHYADKVDEDESDRLLSNDPEDLVPDGKVIKFVFEVSHAPFYLMQLDNGMLVGAYAHVEYADEEHPKPFVPPRDKVEEYLESDHVETFVLDKENSPFRARRDD